MSVMRDIWLYLETVLDRQGYPADHKDNFIRLCRNILVDPALQIGELPSYLRIRMHSHADLVADEDQQGIQLSQFVDLATADFQTGVDVASGYPKKNL